MISTNIMQYIPINIYDYFQLMFEFKNHFQNSILVKLTYKNLHKSKISFEKLFAS